MKNIIRALANSLGYDIVQKRNSNTNIDDHLANIFLAKNIDCVIDVGANSGQYAQSLRKLGFKGKIVSFEPVATVYDVLEKNSSADPDWLTFRCALGDINEDKQINVYKSSVFSSFLKANESSKDIWTSLKTSELETVSVKRLDDIFADILMLTGCKRFYLKLDTQGFDINVFRGAKQTLSNIEAMQSELPLVAVYDGMSAPYDVLKEFHESGFFVSGMYPVNRHSSLAIIEYDCVLVKVPELLQH